MSNRRLIWISETSMIFGKIIHFGLASQNSNQEALNSLQNIEVYILAIVLQANLI